VAGEWLWLFGEHKDLANFPFHPSKSNIKFYFQVFIRE